MSIFWRPRGCVLWFDFATLSGGTAYDLSGQKNNGTIYGATWKRGYLVGALSFDGVDDYVEVPHSASLDITDKVTIEMLLTVRTRDLTEEAPAWFFWVMKDGSYRLGWEGWSDGWGFGVWIGGAWTPVGARDYYMMKDRYYHAVGTFDGRYLRVYEDAVLVGERDLGATYLIDSTTNPLTIRARLNIAFDVAFARIYNRVLTEREIKAHYHYLTKPMARVPI